MLRNYISLCFFNFILQYLTFLELVFVPFVFTFHSIELSQSCTHSHKVSVFIQFDPCLLFHYFLFQFLHLILGMTFFLTFYRRIWLFHKKNL